MKSASEAFAHEVNGGISLSLVAVSRSAQPHELPCSPSFKRVSLRVVTDRYFRRRLICARATVALCRGSGASRQLLCCLPSGDRSLELRVSTHHCCRTISHASKNPGGRANIGPGCNQCGNRNLESRLQLLALDSAVRRHRHAFTTCHAFTTWHAFTRCHSPRRRSYPQIASLALS